MTDQRYKVLIGLDRDGTLVHDPGYLGRNSRWKDQIKLLPGTVEGLKALRQIPNSRIIVCSNQTGIAKGYFHSGVVEESNRIIDLMLREQGAWVDSWYYCPFVPTDYAHERGIDNIWVQDTDLRKPGTGMLTRDASSINMSLGDFNSVYFIGDKFSDVLTGLNANGSGIFLDNNDNEHVQEGLDASRKAMPEYEGRVFIAKDLEDAAGIVNIASKLQTRNPVSKLLS